MNAKHDIEQLRMLIRQQPAIVLDDVDLMKDLAKYAKGNLGENVVDLRDAALKVLARRRELLEKSNQKLAQETQQNYFSAQRVHLAVIQLFQVESVHEFCEAISQPVKVFLGVDSIHVIIDDSFNKLFPNQLLGPITFCHSGFAAQYYGQPPSAFNACRIRLRACVDDSLEIYRRVDMPVIKSEALLPIRLQRNQSSHQVDSEVNSLMLLGSCDPAKFQIGMGTDLLDFFRQVAECTLQRLAK